MTEARAPVPLATLLEHRGFVRALARRLVADAARADDLEQQVWTEAVRNPPRDDRGLRGWLARVVRRRARDQRRGERRFSAAVARAAFERTAPAADAVVAQAETAERLVRLVLTLDEPYRTAILLRFYEDLAPEAVAARTGVPVETVRTRVRRGIDRLRERLGGDGPEARAKWVAALAALADGGGGGIGGDGGARATPRGSRRALRAASLPVSAVRSFGGGAIMAGTTTLLVVAAAGLGVGGAVGWVLHGAVEDSAVEARVAAPTTSEAAAGPRASPRAAPRTDAAPAPAPPPPVAAQPVARPAVKPIRGRVVTVAGEQVGGAVVFALPREGGPIAAGRESSIEHRNTVFAAYAQTLRMFRIRSSIEVRTAVDGTFEIACAEDSPHAVWVFPSAAQVRPPADFAADSVGPGDTVTFQVLPTAPDQLRARLLDSRLTSRERIEAFSQLERREPLDDESIRAVIELLRSEGDARNRATILRELHGKKSPLLVEPLLASLRDDPDEDVREEAAETLDGFLVEPRVVDALTAAKDGDASRKVREQAAESLAGGERKGR